MKRFSLSIVLLIVGLAVQPEDLDSLFEEEDMVEEIIEEPGKKPPEEELLVSDVMEWGGSFTCEFTSSWTWLYPGGVNLADPDQTALETDLSASLFFDSRPDRNFRVFGKIKASYPFSTELSSEPVSVNNIEVFELFSDFNWNDTLFFRVGKHTIKWGVGYFFSPADVLNLYPIDPDDPEGEREGPVSLKINMPLDIHNLYLYSIANNIEKPEEIAVAPKVEFVIGNTELGIGGFYRSNLAPRGILTVTSPLWVLDFFGEAVLSYGSDRTFVREIGTPPCIETYREEDKAFFSGTAGFSCMNEDISLSLSGQYLFNGDGYKNSDLLQNAYLLVELDQLSQEDLKYFGKHYAALNLNWSSILDTDLGFSAFWMGNLCDGSGYIYPSLFYQVLDHAKISLGMRINYGDDGDEYTLAGKTISFCICASVEDGRF